jgi:hypothetical protein
VTRGRCVIKLLPFLGIWDKSAVGSRKNVEVEVAALHLVFCPLSRRLHLYPASSRYSSQYCYERPKLHTHSNFTTRAWFFERGIDSIY